MKTLARGAASPSTGSGRPFDKLRANGTRWQAVRLPPFELKVFLPFGLSLSKPSAPLTTLLPFGLSLSKPRLHRAGPSVVVGTPPSQTPSPDTQGPRA
jgi:hypothetical protein